jgi:hypothetical protein
MHGNCLSAAANGQAFMGCHCMTLCSMHPVVTLSAVMGISLDLCCSSLSRCAHAAGPTGNCCCCALRRAGKERQALTIGLCSDCSHQSQQNEHLCALHGALDCAQRAVDEGPATAPTDKDVSQESTSLAYSKLNRDFLLSGILAG